MSGTAVHSLGTTVALTAAVLAAVLLAAETRGHTGSVRRLRQLLGERPASKTPSVLLRRIRGPARRWGPPVAAGLGAYVLVGGPLGALVAVAAALGARVWLGRRQRAADSPEGNLGPDPAELPLCADLMAACLAAGATPGEAAGAVGRCLGGPLGDALIRVRAELRLGGEAAECWDRFGRLPEAREMGRCLARASTTGSAPVAEMSRLAADYRAAHARSALARARKAAVLATAPLGVCFLPAFLLVGVAPVVIGLAGAVLGGGMS